MDEIQLVEGGQEGRTGGGAASDSTTTNLPPRGANARARAAGWWYTVTHASRLYWALQIINSMGSVFVTVQLLQSAAQFGGTPRDNAFLGAVLDAFVLLAMTHLLLRPLLLGAFVRQRATLTAWSGLVMALLACAVFSVLAADLLATLSRVRGPIQEIRFHTGTSEFGIALNGWQLFAMQVVNALMAYVLWTAVYLGWKAIAARRELQRKVKHARMWQLTRQMGPHFLFNAFNSIRGLMYEDRDRAAQLITRLSDLLRVQLGMHEETHQSLREECRMARDYLEIELVRLEPRLSYSFDIARECENLMLPTLTVLTAVENAVKHGIAPNPELGWIRICARPATKGWVLEVINSYGPPSTVQSTGIGLKNLRERLLLSTNGQAKVEYQKERDAFRLRMDLLA